MNRDHSVICEIASKLYISDSFIDYDGYSISSKGFLPTVTMLKLNKLNMFSCFYMNDIFFKLLKKKFVQLTHPGCVELCSSLDRSLSAITPGFLKLTSANILDQIIFCCSKISYAFSMFSKPFSYAYEVPPHESWQPTVSPSNIKCFETLG